MRGLVVRKLTKVPDLYLYKVQTDHNDIYIKKLITPPNTI